MSIEANLKACIPEIKKAAKDDFDDDQILALVERIKQRAKNIPQERLESAEARIRNASDELVGELKVMEQIQKRNGLMTLRAVRNMEASLANYDSPFEGILAYLEDSRKKVEGANRGVNSVIEGWKSRYLGALKARLEEEDLVREFKADELEREIFMEFYEPGVSKSENARKIRDILVSLKQDMVEKQNLHGSWIHFMPEHVKRQTYSPNLIKKNFGPARFSNGRKLVGNRHMSVEEEEAAKKAFLEFLDPLLDWEQTAGGDVMDKNAKTFADKKKKFLEGIWKGVFHGEHGRNELGSVQKSNGASINTSFFKAGLLAKRISTERVLHFKDGEAAYKAHKAFSADTLSSGFVSEIEHASHNIGLMQMMGPNPEQTLIHVISRTLDKLADKSGNEDKITELQNKKRKLFTALKFLNNEAKIPNDPTLHTFVGAISSAISMSKLGSLALFAFPDKAILQSTMTRNGIGSLEALAKALNLRPPKNETERLALIRMGAEMKSFINTVNSRFSTGAEGYAPTTLHNLNRTFFNATGINWMDDVGTQAIIQTLTQHLGAHSTQTWDKLLPALRDMLSNFGFSHREWNLIRKTAYSLDPKTGDEIPFDAANAYLTPDQMSARLTQADLDELLDFEKVKKTENNRKRKLAELESKFHSYLSAQRDEAVLIPGSKEHRLASFGTQAGTGIGSVVRLLTMFKSYPITIATKILAREFKGTGSKNVIEWLQGQSNNNWRSIQLMGMLTIAGYISLSISQAISGKVPPGFTDKKGEFDASTSLDTVREAFLRGGVGGLYADLLFREYDNSYNTLGRFIGGPVVSELDKLAEIGNLAMFQGDVDTGKIFRFTKANLPFVNLFYVKPALDFLLWNTIQEAIEPGSLRELEKLQDNRYDTRYWLPPSKVNEQIFSQ